MFIINLQNCLWRMFREEAGNKRNRTDFAESCLHAKEIRLVEKGH